MTAVDFTGRKVPVTGVASGHIRRPDVLALYFRAVFSRPCSGLRR